MPLDRFKRRFDANVDPAVLELTCRVVAELPGDLREDLGSRVDEHPMLRDMAERAVVAHGVAHEIGELRERLDACVAGADEHEGELTSLLLFTRGGGSGLQTAQDVVPQIDRVGQALEAERVVGEAGDGQCPRDGAERDDEVRVLDRDDVFLRLDGRLLLIGVDCSRAAEEQLRVRTHHPQRNDDVARLEGAGSRLRQHRRVEHEVLRRSDRRAALAEQARDVAAGEAAAEDERATERGAVRHGSTLRRELRSTRR